MRLNYLSFFFLTLFTVITFAQNEQLLYDGTSDFCAIPNGETLFSSLNVFTVEVWIRSTDVSNSPIFIGSLVTSTPPEILFGITSNAEVAFSTGFGSGGNLVTANAGTFPTDGMWHHIACVRTGSGAGQGTIYIDGVDQTNPAVNTPGTNAVTTADLSFGLGLTTFFLNGAMDEVRIWNVARSQTQINNFKDVQLAGNETGLIGYWKFNEGSGQNVLDSQTNGTVHNGTLGADANVSSDDPTRIQDPALPLPVELVSFSATVNNSRVELRWITASETNNMGFDVERKSESSSTFQKIGFVEGNGTSNQLNNYSFIDVVSQPGTYFYRLKQIDFDGSEKYSNEILAEVETVPLTFNLDQNYPNPFNPSTTISFTLPEDGFINLTVYNSLGEEVTQLMNEFKKSGKYQVNFNASNLSSGLYIYRVNFSNDVSNYSSSKIMSLVK